MVTTSFCTSSEIEIISVSSSREQEGEGGMAGRKKEGLMHS